MDVECEATVGCIRLFLGKVRFKEATFPQFDHNMQNHKLLAHLCNLVLGTIAYRTCHWNTPTPSTGSMSSCMLMDIHPRCSNG